jgi:phosphate-selective porin OprO/OprP
VGRSTNDFQVRIYAETRPDASQPVNGAGQADKRFHWDLSWRGWDGLYLGISESTRLKTPREMLGLPPSTNELRLHLEQLKITSTIGALMEVDGAAYSTTKNFDLANDIAVRRARIYAQGDSILVFPFSYKVELGYVPHKFILNQAWISSEHIDYLGYVKAGVFQPPMGLDLITRSRDITFMEPASVLQALAPANEAGIQIGQPVLDQRATWTLGIFGNSSAISDEYGNNSRSYGNLISRLTCLPMEHLSPGQPDENEFLHLGLSASVQYSTTSTVNYRSRPESYLAPHLIATDDIDADRAGTVGAEAAYVKGPLTIQSEFLDSLVGENSGANLNFYGFYASASWYLTGESRSYDRANGDFARLIPRSDFDFDKGGGWGAFEIAGRVSYTDLTDQDVHGGRMLLFMGGLNWYLNPHVKWMFNLGGGNISEAKRNGDILIFQTRIGIDF